MFRQIIVNKSDADLQRILWRFHPNDTIKTYRLTTVTYGTASAPYLASKVLHQLAEDHRNDHPAASTILKEHFYVDDALFGAYDIQSARNLRDEICTLLKKGGFHLRKWLTNLDDLLEGIPTADREQTVSSKLVSDAQIKALGVVWNPAKDVFSLHTELPPSKSVTKRSVLADVSRVYDPLGWLSPATVRAKLFLQRLWMNKVDWDDTLPLNLQENWLTQKDELQSLKNFEIQRWIGTKNTELGLELHGFCDASLQAYGAAVYLRVIHTLDDVQVSLIAAKTRVSPIKTVSLPRLELCGATLLSELMSFIQRHLKLDKVSTHLWTDSTIVLAWLRDHPSKWTVFVANRVALIHEKMPNAIWHHIPSYDNPADCIIRGMTVNDLDHYNLWWSGPSWLTQPSRFWPQTSSSLIDTQLQEEVRPVHVAITKATDPEIDLLYRYSSLQKLLRITAYCQRFVHNCKSSVKRFGSLKLEETASALQTWIKLVQKSFFHKEIKCLLANKPPPSNSNLKNLSPVIDENYVLRVGGRLKNSLLTYEEKFPAILPKTSQLTKLIIDYSHNITLHGGIQATLQHIRTKYWIINGRNKVRQFVRNCITCFRQRATTKSQIMADLPPDRVRPAKPFLHSGADYAGPFTIKPVKGRTRTFIKTYVVLFICLATRAVHLELIFNLTTEAFVTGFRRFVRRRGRCSKLYTDNATYFTSADKELNQHLQDLLTQSNIAQLLIEEGTEWHFIPPGSPHFGGIWEAGIKAFKHHFRRIVGSQTLDLEEMLTLISQIEACLNSRPLQPLRDDPNEISALTTGHFLVGESLLTVPTPSTLDMPMNRLKRWQLVQMMLEQLWHRWRTEYVHHLQLRNKWQKKEEPVKMNDLVLIKDERLPPATWLLGRVIAVHPGADNQIRVVTIKHKNGICKRAITKICVLPSES